MDRKANITIERTSGQITGRVAEGFVLVREGGDLSDRIQDSTAELPDGVYDAVELAISGEDIVEAGELTGEVEVDGVTYRWTVRLPGVTEEAMTPSDLATWYEERGMATPEIIEALRGATSWGNIDPHLVAGKGLPSLREADCGPRTFAVAVLGPIISEATDGRYRWERVHERGRSVIDEWHGQIRAYLFGPSGPTIGRGPTLPEGMATDCVEGEVIGRWRDRADRDGLYVPEGCFGAELAPGIVPVDPETVARILFWFAAEQIRRERQRAAWGY